MISVMVSSLSNCSSGPKPTISSMMSPSSLTRSWRPIGTLSAVRRSSTSSSIRFLSAPSLPRSSSFGIERLHQVGQQLLLELHDKFLRRIGLGRGGALRIQRRGLHGMQRGGRRGHGRQRLRGGRRNARDAGECLRHREDGPELRRDAEWRRERERPDD